jgi:hypothetical protein
MTKKDYKAIADLLNRFSQAKPTIDNTELKGNILDGTLDILFEMFCDMLLADNGRFDRDKFREAVYKTE